MNTVILRISALLLVLAQPLSAFAIDQVTLTNGQMFEGTVLNDVPNRHVDLRLINGKTKRFQRGEIAGVDRDVPSTSDRSLRGNQSGMSFSGFGGGYANLNSTTTQVVFDMGVKAAINASNLDFAWLTFGLSYDYISNLTPGAIAGAGNSMHDLNGQVLFTRIGNSGFYGGMIGGLVITSQGSLFGTPGGSTSTTQFQIGADAGYDFFISDSFSLGPEARFEHLLPSSTTVASNTDSNFVKFFLNLSYHL
jgi:hypothetical protein